MKRKYTNKFVSFKVVWVPRETANKTKVSRKEMTAKTSSIRPTSLIYATKTKLI